MKSNVPPTYTIAPRKRPPRASVWLCLCTAMICLAWSYVPDTRAALTNENAPRPSVAGVTHGGSALSPNMHKSSTPVIQRDFPGPGATQLDQIDLTKPATVTEVGRWPGGGVHAVALDANRNLAFVGLEHAIGILKISGEPSPNPTLASVLTTTDTVSDLFYANQLLYAVVNEGLLIIDVSDPKHPVQTGSLDTSTPVRDLFVAGNFVYFAGGDAGLRIIDATDPAHLAEVGSFTGGGALHSLYVAGSFAYVIDSGLRIIDVSEPAHPTEVGFFDCMAMDVHVVGNYAYLAAIEASSGNGGLMIVDVSDPAQPAEIGSDYISFNHTFGVYVADNRAYLTRDRELYDRGIAIFDVSDPAHPTREADIATRGWIGGVCVVDDHAYVAAGGEGLLVIDLSDRWHPRQVGRFASGGKASGVYVRGNYAYVPMAVSYADCWHGCGPVGLRIVNVTDPTHPKEVGFCPTKGDSLGVFVTGKYAYVVENPIPYVGSMDSGYGLSILKVSDRRHPTKVSFLELEPRGYSTYGVHVKGNYAYVVASDGLKIVDVGDAAHPKQVGFSSLLGLSSGRGIYVRGSYAYVAATAYTDGTSGLHIINIGDPTHPAEVGSVATPGEAHGVHVAGDYAYLAADRAGLRIINVSDPTHPKEVGFLRTEGSATSVTVAGAYAYVAGTATAGVAGGLHIVKISNPAKPKEVGIFHAIGGSATGVCVSAEFVYVANGPEGMSIINRHELAGSGQNAVIHHP